MSRWTNPLVGATGGLAIALLLGGCGYTVGYSRAAKGIRTVAVQVVGNDTFRQRFERYLTREIAVSLSEYSGYRHAPASKADAILEVAIVGIRNTTLVIGNPILEGSLDSVARIRLIERRTERVIVETHLRDVAEYRTPLGENEASARSELAFDLGRRIVLALEAAF